MEQLMLTLLDEKVDINVHFTFGSRDHTIICRISAVQYYGTPQVFRKGSDAYGKTDSFFWGSGTTPDEAFRSAHSKLMAARI